MSITPINGWIDRKPRLIGHSHLEPQIEPAGPPPPEQIDEWMLEPELAASIPRRIVLSWVEIIVRVLPQFPFFFLCAFFREWWLVVIFGAWVVASVIRTEWLRRLSKALVERGTPTRGVVLERIWHKPHRGFWSKPHRGSYTYVIDYETPAERFQCRSHDPVSRRIWRGDAITVLYLPESPNRAMPYECCLYKAVSPEERK
jgi:hypothetical protein